MDPTPSPQRRSACTRLAAPIAAALAAQLELRAEPLGAPNAAPNAALYSLWSGAAAPAQPWAAAGQAASDSEASQHLAAAEALLAAGEVGAALARLDRALAEVPIGLAGHRAAAERGVLLQGLDRLPIQIGIEAWLGDGAEDSEASRRLLFAGLERSGALGPAARHLALLELYRWALVEFEPQALRAALIGALEQPDAALRLAAAELGARLPAEPVRALQSGAGPPATAGEAQPPPALPGLALALLERALIDREAAVRWSAARALQRHGDAAWELAFERALRARDWSLRQHAAEALALSALPAAEGVLLLALARAPAAVDDGADAGGSTALLFSGRQRAYVGDFDVEVATGQSIADPRVDVLSEGAALWVRVCHIESRQQAFRRQLRAALEQVRGRALPADFGARAAQAEFEAWSARQGAVHSGG